MPVLLSQFQVFNGLFVDFTLRALEVAQEAIAAANELDKPVTSGVIFFVSAHVSSEILDSRGDQCDLDRSGTGIFFVVALTTDDLFAIV